MKQRTKQQSKKKFNPLPRLAAVVVLAAAAVILLPKLFNTGSATAPEETPLPTGGDPVIQPEETTLPTSNDLVIQTEEIGTEASYFDYDVEGITVQVLAVRASDNTVRLALNTCQVCNGSPYAYFEQEGEDFVCQNCKSHFSSTDVGIVSGGCNPVPITEDVYLQQDGTITIPSSFLQENASRFVNWKKF